MVANQGETVLFSNKRCRLEYDAQASGHLRVAMLPPGGFEVVSVNRSTGTIKIVVENNPNPDSMEAFLYREATVGSNFDLSSR